MLDPFRIGGSFRDPSGSVYTVKGRVFRSVNPVAKKRYEFIRDSGLLKKVINIGYLINTWELDVQDWPKQLADAAYVLEHDLIPHISHLQSRAKIVKPTKLSVSGRILFEYDRR